jgi:hypothetical protein
MGKVDRLPKNYNYTEGLYKSIKEVSKNWLVVVRSHSNNNIPEGNAPKIKYFEPASMENSDFLFYAEIT